MFHWSRWFMQLFQRQRSSAAPSRARLGVAVLERREVPSITAITPEIRAGASAGNTQGAPRLAMDAEGDTAVVWQSSNASGGSDVYLQRYDTFGNAVGAAVDVSNDNTADANVSPSVAMDAAGDVVVAWLDNSASGATGILVQRYSALGTALGGPVAVSASVAVNGPPSVAMDAEGDFVVTWAGSDSATPGGNTDSIYAQQFAANGQAVSGAFAVDTNAADVDQAPAVAMDTEGDFVVAWNQGNSANGTYAVQAQLYSAAGAAQGNAFQVNVGSADAGSLPAVGMDGVGDFTVAWASNANALAGHQINVDRFNAQGTLQGGEMQANSYNADVQTMPSVAEDANGNTAIAWASEGQDGSGYGVYAQRYTAAGTPLVPIFQVNTFTAGDQLAPSVAVNASGDMGVAWQSDGQGGNDAAVYTRLYDSNFTPSLNLASATVPGTVGFPITNTGTVAFGNPANPVTMTASLGTITGDPSTGTWTWSYTPIAATTSPTPVTITATDGYTIISKTFTYTAVVSQPPTLDGANAFTSIGATNLNSAGDPVSALAVFGNTGTGAQPGIAVDGLTSGHGTWQYSLDGGQTWLNVGAVSDANALLLGPTDQLRFVPDGVDSDDVSVTFRGWSQAAGAAGTYVSAAQTGVGTLFTTNTATASLQVTTLPPTQDVVETLTGHFSGNASTDVLSIGADGTLTVGVSTGSGFVSQNWGQWLPASNFRAFYAADFSGDGKTDLLGWANDGSLYVGVSTGSGFVTTKWAQWSSADHWSSLLVGDFAGNGRASVLGFNDDGSWWAGVSTGTSFTTQLWAQWSTAAHWNTVLAGDFTGNGTLDVAAFNNDGTWWLGLPTGTAMQTQLWAQWSTADHWAKVTVGDFTGDGKADVAGFNNDGTWWVGVSTGTGFTTQLWASWSTADHWANVVVGDFTDDGKTDIAVLNNDGTWWVGHSTGSSFQASTEATWQPAADWTTIRTGDFNADGKTDLLGVNADGTIWVALSSGQQLLTQRWS